jgi:uncharacterized protein (DUF433 family)
MLREEVKAKLKVYKDLKELIVEEPDMLGGKPTIFGTRLSIEWLLEKLTAGYTCSELLKDYPTLYPEGIDAAIAFASALPPLHPLAQLLQEYHAVRCR